MKSITLLLGLILIWALVGADGYVLDDGSCAQILPSDCGLTTHVDFVNENFVRKGMLRQTCHDEASECYCQQCYDAKMNWGALGLIKVCHQRQQYCDMHLLHLFGSRRMQGSNLRGPIINHELINQIG